MARQGVALVKHVRIRENTDMDTMLTWGLEDRLYTAAAARVHWKNEVIYQQFYGTPDPRVNGVPVTKRTLFDLASLTKVFVATVFMSLVSAGEIELDTRICEVLPEYGNCRRKSKVTVRHILSHSSGLPPTFNLYRAGEWALGKDYVKRKLLAVPLAADPGTETIYSCLGYMLAGLILEAITNKHLDELVEGVFGAILGGADVLYKPINKRSNIAVTTFTRPNRGVLRPGVVHDGNAIAFEGGVSGNAGLFGTINAVSTLGESYLIRRILPGYLIDEMISVQKPGGVDKRGIGWRLHTLQNNNPGRVLSVSSYGHTGYTGTSLWIDPKIDLVITLLTNSVHFYKSDKDVERFGLFRIRFHKAARDYCIDG